MKIFGVIKPGETEFIVPANYKRTFRVRAPSTPIRIPKLTILCDGLGPGVGDQVWDGIIYDIFGNLIAQGDEHVVKDGMPLTWFDLRFSKFRTGVPILANQVIDLGFHAGENANTIRVYGDPSQGL